MPRRNYRRRPAVRRRTTTKRYGKRYGRRRWKRKQFNNVNQLSMRATLASKLLRVKLPWVQTFNTTVAATTSPSFAFQGNGLVPYTSVGQMPAFNTPTPGDIYPAGALEYSQFYDKYFINGSSINIEVVSTNSQALASSPLLRAVLLAMPYTVDQTELDTGDDDFPAVLAQLNQYTYEQLLAWPYAKWRMLASNTGGSSRLRFKMFRKTKNMCGVKDIRDNQQLSGRLPDGSLELSPSPNEASNLTINPLQGFMYYLRFFNADATTGAPINITVRMKLYTTMTSREFNPVQTIISNE